MCAALQRGAGVSQLRTDAQHVCMVRRVVLLSSAALVVLLLTRKPPEMASAPHLATPSSITPVRLVTYSPSPTVIHTMPPTLPAPIAAPPCPVRVHIYNASLIDESSLRRRAFGDPYFGQDQLRWLTRSDQHGLGGMLVSTMLRNPDCLSPPEHADVFVVPLFREKMRQATAEEARKVHTFMPPSEMESIIATCRRISTVNWTAALHPHLTPRTAFRHIFLHEKYLAIHGFCVGSDKGFLRAADANPSLRNWAWPDNAIYTEEHFRRGFSFAFPSAVHLRAADLVPRGGGDTIDEAATANVSHLPLLARGQPPWAPGALINMPRKFLMMFGGSMHGHARAQQIRRFLHDKCIKYSEPVCKLVYAEQSMWPGPSALSAIIISSFGSDALLRPSCAHDVRSARDPALSICRKDAVYLLPRAPWLWRRAQGGCRRTDLGLHPGHLRPPSRASLLAAPLGRRVARADARIPGF